MASNTVDDMDGTGNNISMPPGTPEYQKVRLAMEQIHVSSFSSLLNTIYFIHFIYNWLKILHHSLGFIIITFFFRERDYFLSRQIWHICRDLSVF